MAGILSPSSIRANGSNLQNSPKPFVLPILLASSSLRPLAFRTFSKKHGLTVTSTALEALATFIGKNCGSGWREEGLAELALDQIAKTWKWNSGGVIVDTGAKPSLENILGDLEKSMADGPHFRRTIPAASVSDIATKVFDRSEISVGNAHAFENNPPLHHEAGPRSLDNKAFAGYTNHTRPRDCIKVVNAFEQPSLTYNVNRKNFEPSINDPSLFPSPPNRVNLFRDRYYRVYQRLIRNEAFQLSTSSLSSQLPNPSLATSNQPYRLTPIASLPGRNGTTHLLLGLLSKSLAGGLSLSDPSGNIALDLFHAKGVPENGAWFGTGMIVLVDGIYEEQETGLNAGSQFSRNSEAINGKFVAVSVGSPPCERRQASLGVENRGSDGNSTTPEFSGPRDIMVGDGSTQTKSANLQDKNFPSATHSERKHLVIMGEVNLDIPNTLQSLKNVLGLYESLPAKSVPLAFLLIGNFVHDIAIGSGECGSIVYKEYFDNLATILAQYPSLLQNATFVFVPGDNDPWASSFSAGRTASIPRPPIPELFTSRIQRVFHAAINQGQGTISRNLDETVIWSSNPTRLNIPGAIEELVVFRDDVSSRLRRNSLDLTENCTSYQMKVDKTLSDDNSIIHSRDDSEVKEHPHCADSGVKKKEMTDEDFVVARKLVKSILDQGHLCPFPPTIRPVLWDYASALHLHPLPTALVLADSQTSPFTVTYEGCHVMNPGRLGSDENSDKVTWVEYDVNTKRGCIREQRF